MNDRKIKVLYIAGSGRSGSTILNVILGQLDGFFGGSEIKGIWDCGVQENRVCGCGDRFHECKTWKPIFQEAFGGMTGVDPARMVYLRERLAQTKFLPPMLLHRDRGPRQTPKTREFLGNLDKLYRAIQTVTGCRVIVDASKWPSYAYMVESLPSVELYVLHLIRDPRGVSHSWTRKKESAPGRLFPQHSPIRTTIYWNVWHPSITYLWDRRGKKHLFMRYEDFVAHPQKSVAEIMRFVNEKPHPGPFVDEHTVELEKTHGVAGNKTRFISGTVKIKQDDEWKRKFPLHYKFLVTAMTFPLLRRYGYNIFEKPV